MTWSAPSFSKIVGIETRDEQDWWIHENGVQSTVVMREEWRDGRLEMRAFFGLATPKPNPERVTPSVGTKR